MGTGIFFPLCALPFSMLIILLFFVKEHIDSKETRIFSTLIVSNFFGLVIEILCTYASRIYSIYPFISNIIYKLYLFYLILWISTMLYYVYSVTQGDSSIRKSRIPIFFMYYVFIFIFIIILPIEVVIKDNFNIRYTTGQSVDFTYAISILLILVMIILLLKNLKTIRNKKYVPVFLFLIIGGIATVIQIFWPQFLLMTYVETLICLIMYFTIENPDLKMLNEMTLARNMAEKANRAKSDFLSSMSHEIRTPLNAIVGLSEDIESFKDQVPKEVVDDIHDIRSASNILLEIVGNILDINKIESEHMDIIEKEYNFKEEISNMAKFTSARIEDKPIEFEVVMADDIPDILIGDKNHVKEVINNLLTNAIKYTEKGRVSLTVKCINKDDVCNLIISVQDTGRGIKKENIEKLFTKFQRLDEDMNTTITGSGLGLAITKSLVDLMHGTINVESQYGSGSLFMVNIPQKIGKYVDDRIDEETNYNYLKSSNLVEVLDQEEKENIDDTLDDASFKRILIVDDNKLNIKVASKLLSNLPYRIDECYNGIQCLEKLKVNNYDLILMDIMMPEMDGNATIKKLKSNNSFKTPVIALTADAVSFAEEKYLSEGFDGYISKPYKKEDLEMKIKEVLQSKMNNSQSRINWDSMPKVIIGEDTSNEVESE